MFELQQELSMLQKRSLKQHEASDRIHKILKGLGALLGCHSCSRILLRPGFGSL